MRSHIGWREERTTSYKSIETSLLQTRFKNRKANSDISVDLSCYTFFLSIGTSITPPFLMQSTGMALEYQERETFTAMEFF